MPLFEFRCGSCRAEFEALCRSVDAEEVECPRCGGRRLSRLISRFAVSRQLTPCGARSSDAPASCRGAGMADGCCACERAA